MPDQEAVEDDLAAVVGDIDHAAEAPLDLVAVVDREAASELFLEEGGEIGGDLVPFDTVVEGVADDRGRHEVAEGDQVRLHFLECGQYGRGASGLDPRVGIKHPELTDGEAVELARDHGLRDRAVAAAPRAARRRSRPRVERRRGGRQARSCGRPAR